MTNRVIDGQIVTCGARACWPPVPPVASRGRFFAISFVAIILEYPMDGDDCCGVVKTASRPSRPDMINRFGTFSYTCEAVSHEKVVGDSFEELAMPLFESLYNFAQWLTHRREEAEDLVHLYRRLTSRH